MSNNIQRVSKDRFGNDFVLVGCKPKKKNEKYSVGYVEIKGQLYKIEPTEAEKEGIMFWCKLTKLEKRKPSSF